MLNNIKYKLIQNVKSIIYFNGEKYEFGGKNLKFKPNSRPIKREYINSNSDVVRNDVLQILYLEKIFKPGDVIWDIGSHYGHYSIFAASVVNGANQIFSFEPDISARLVQEANIKMNFFESKIKLFDFVVSEFDGSINFMDRKGDSTSHIVNEDAAIGGNIISKKSRSLNSLLEEIPVPNYIKLDTEGAEIDILKGGSKLLENKEVKFICELHPFAWEKFNVSFSDFTDILKKYERELKILDTKKTENELPFYGTVLF